MLSIGDLSKRTEVKIPTIRYYEKMGLISPAERSQGNQRRYDQDGLKHLSFIRHSRELGFSIEDIRRMLDLNQHPETPCDNACGIAARHLADVRQKITKLKRLERELKRISQCDGQSIAECLVIETLSDHALCEGEH